MKKRDQQSAISDRWVGICAPALSACVIMVRAEALEAPTIAAAIFLGARRVTAAIADPLPLKNAPSAPARSAAAITRGKNGISFARNG
jgi:hypothetical protein